MADDKTVAAVAITVDVDVCSGSDTEKTEKEIHSQLDLITSEADLSIMATHMMPGLVFKAACRLSCRSPASPFSREGQSRNDNILDNPSISGVDHDHTIEKDGKEPAPEPAPASGNRSKANPQSGSSQSQSQSADPVDLHLDCEHRPPFKRSKTTVSE